MKQVLGGCEKKQFPQNQGLTYNLCYIKPLFSFPTIDMVIKSPYYYEVTLNDFVINEDNCFYFFLYDKETDLIVGSVDEIYFGEVVEIVPDNIKENLIEFAEDYRSIISRLKEAFGEDFVTVSYGIITYSG